MFDLFTQSSAEFDASGEFRYRLTRIWSNEALLPERLVNWLMLNPSTADANVNDPTIERCMRRSEEMGYDGVVVTNLFAFRTPSPALLRLAPDPIGPDNDRHVIDVAEKAALVICGWGTHGDLLGRANQVTATLRARGIKLHVLGVNQDGSPKHPLYVSYHLKPRLWNQR